MIKNILMLSLSAGFLACKTADTGSSPGEFSSDYTIAFGSCNRHTLPNLLWDDIRESRPDLWIWGGDNIYADTSDVAVIASMYNAQKKVKGYRRLRSEIQVVGSWDDHDYGLNDGGVEWIAKEESQQAFLDFIDVPETNPMRSRKGIYVSHNYILPKGNIKVIILDTRYYRTSLTPDPSGVKRYIPNKYGEGTILGELQWEWLEKELNNSKADFNILVSSIQVLSDQHGYETWGNFPHEVDRLKNLILRSGAKGVLILSGDRHFAECSKTNIEGMNYPLLDFTSSGLTHAYKEYSGEPNPYRIGEVVATENFGLVFLNLSKKSARLQIVGDGGDILAEFEQLY